MRRSVSLPVLLPLVHTSPIPVWVEQFCIPQPSRQSRGFSQAIRRQWASPTAGSGSEGTSTAYVHAAKSCTDLLLLSGSAQQTQLPSSQRHPQQQQLSQQEQQQYQQQQHHQHQQQHEHEQQQPQHQQFCVKPSRPPDPIMHFFNHAVAPQYQRKPVQWFRPGDEPPARQPATRPVHPVAAEDPWALGEAPAAQRQPPPRKRLSWAQKPPYQSGMDHNSAQPSSGMRRPARQDHAQGRLRQQLEAERQQRQALAASASHEQYLRNKLQVEQQIASHAATVQKQQEHKQYDRAQWAAAQPSYGALAAPPKPKSPPPPPPVQELPTEVAIPPDVTVRQLAQLLGKQILCLSLHVMAASAIRTWS